jgi:exopolysaccharide biosynthesis polyprenyl glycosylphosphotransferase
MPIRPYVSNSRLTGHASASRPESSATGESAVPGTLNIPAGRDSALRKLLGLADVISAITGLAVVAVAGGRGIPAAGLLTLPLMTLLAKLTGRYDRDELVLRQSTLEELPGLLTLAAAYAVAWSLITSLAGVPSELEGGGVGVLWGATAASLVLARTGARWLARLAAPVERVLIVGSSAARALLAGSLASDPAARLQVVGFLPLEDERAIQTNWPGPSRRRRQRSFADLASVVGDLEVHRVILIPTNADGETLLEAVRCTAGLGVKVSIVPRLFEVVGSAVAFDTVGGVTVLGIRQPGLTRTARVTKRAMDVIGSTVGLLALTPVMAAIAIAIKLDSPGSVLFRQQRVGRDGEVFEMLKFRSMVEGAEAKRSALDPLNETRGNFKLAADPRMTTVGRALRRSSIDELPQLINVLRGDMSLVGPRPLVSAEDRLVGGRHRERLHLAPGITGPWQVLGPARPPLSEMVKTDYLYAINWSVWADIKLLLRTLSHVLGRRGL